MKLIYDANWRFQTDDPDGDNFFVKILTERGDLVVTNIYNEDYESGDAALQSRITGITNENPNIQSFAICNDCRQDL